MVNRAVQGDMFHCVVLTAATWLRIGIFNVRILTVSSSRVKMTLLKSFKRLFITSTWRCTLDHRCSIPTCLAGELEAVSSGLTSTTAAC